MFQSAIFNKRHILYLLMLLLAVVLVATSWVGDDIYFTMRTVNNFLHGDGLRWNAGDRVQVFTHPLWALILLPLCWWSGEFYLTPIMLCLFCSFSFILLLVFKLAKETNIAIFALFAMLFSKSFLDYSVSGLENPLSYFLLACFCYQFFTFKVNRTKVGLLYLFASLVLTTRMDLALLIAPACIACFVQILRHPQRFSLIKICALGMLPFLCWELFSLFYYGYFVPNTYYAKTGHGISPSEIARQGLNYFSYSLHNDPVTILCMAAGMLVAFLVPIGTAQLLGLGIALYLLFILKIGGDFMGGRYFGAAFVLSIINLVYHLRGKVSNLALPISAVAVALLGFTVSDQNVLMLVGATEPKEKEEFDNPWGGVLNERQFYFKKFGLINSYATYRANGQIKNAFPEREVLHNGPPVVIHPNAGVFGFLSPRDVYIIDPYALGDPLLSHVDADYNPKWRIGHFNRSLPQGYFDTVNAGINKFADPMLGRYYEITKNITRGDLLSWERIKQIVARQLGNDRYLLSQYKHFQGEDVPESRLALIKPVGFNWVSPSNILIKQGERKEIVLEPGPRGKDVHLSLDHNDIYTVRFTKNGETIFMTKVGPNLAQRWGLAHYDISPPAEVYAQGVDRVVVEPDLGDGQYAIGHFNW
jgi:arabinofuranosyltransferase